MALYCGDALKYLAEKGTNSDVCMNIMSLRLAMYSVQNDHLQVVTGRGSSPAW